ncbi:MAG: DUF1559 domain-containing protein [Planctomycetes bacterium]|nr:DUF1559 domain-containing protein [Planctomycetota bacterium]
MTRRRGLTIIELLVVIAIIGVLVSLLLPAIQAARETARRAQCRSQLKQLGLAVLLYHESHRSFPPGYLYFGPNYAPPVNIKPPGMLILDAPRPTTNVLPNGPGWSWLSLILPNLDQSGLYNAINFNMPVEHKLNTDVRLHSIPIANCPSDQEPSVFTITDYFVKPVTTAVPSSYVACFGSFGNINTDPDHSNGLFRRNGNLRLSDIRDGASSTVAIGERASLFTRAPWAGVVAAGLIQTSPGAPVYSATIEMAPALALARFGHSNLTSPFSEPYDFFSPHESVVFFLFADGSVHGLSSYTDLNVLYGLSTIAGGEVVEIP